VNIFKKLRRQFLKQPLEPGKSYAFQVKISPTGAVQVEPVREYHCPECGGRGEKRERFGGYSEGSFFYMATCWLCKGFGTVTAKDMEGHNYITVGDLQQFEADAVNEAMEAFIQRGDDDVPYSGDQSDYDVDDVPF
jgi:hypothetical protein